MTDDSRERQEKERGTDTPTGTDPEAKYEEPGFEDKSLGQAVEQDKDLAEELAEETGGDVDEAEQRFEEESTGAPALKHQRGDESDRSAERDGSHQDRDT